MHKKREKKLMYTLGKLFRTAMFVFTLIASVVNFLPVAAAPAEVLPATYSTLPGDCSVGTQIYMGSNSGSTECTLAKTDKYGIVLNGSIGETNAMSVRLTDARGNTIVKYFWLEYLPRKSGSEKTYTVPGYYSSITFTLKNKDTALSNKSYHEISSITGAASYVPTDMNCISGMISIAPMPNYYIYTFPGSEFMMYRIANVHFGTQLRQEGGKWVLYGWDKLGEHSTKIYHPMTGDGLLKLVLEDNSGKYTVSYATHYCGGNIHALTTSIAKNQ
jgi:hypothetical protein